MTLTNHVSLRKRVLFFTSHLGGGGAEMHLVRLLNFLQRRDFQPMLAVARGGGSYEKLLDDSLPVHPFRCGKKLSSTAALLLSTGPLTKLIHDFQPHVLVTLLDVPATVGRAAIKRTCHERKPKFVACLQNNFSVKRKRTAWLLRWLNPSIRRAYKEADRVIALSHGVANDLIRNVPQCEMNTTVIYNAAWDDTCQKLITQGPPMERARDLTQLVACGRLTKQKGFEHLLASIAIIKASRPVHLWLLGAGTDEEQLRALAKNLGISDDVQFLGFQANPFAYIQAADIFVLSSLWEGFGNVVAEALACGTPVVATDCPFGPAEILGDGKFGYLAKPADPQDLANKILTLLDSPNEMKRLSETGLERALDFTSSRVGLDYERLLNELIDSPTPAPANRMS